ncbi:response regulator [Allohahella marinimesophila]|uniref:Response regulator n=1 Tax=Allohahella marinimesophila TaxID=1054972 RepID=A0ABP7NQW2_9GAMM
MFFRAYERKKFLIVDDFDSFVISLKQMLRSMGASDVHSARNGDEAIEACLSRHHDVVFCDYNMGDRKNGQQVLEELRHRKLLRHTDIFCMISAEASSDMVFGALEYSPDAYITKPITRALLANRMDKLIELKDSVLDINKAIDLEDYSKAISLCAKHLRIGSKFKVWLYKTQANLFYMVGDYQHAKKIYNDILKGRDIDWARLGLARVLLAEGNAAEAEAEFEFLLQKNPQLVEAYDLKAEAHRQQKQYKLAQQSLMAATAISPMALTRQRKLAELSVDIGDLEQAMSAYKQAVKLSDKSCLENSDTYLQYAQVIADVTTKKAMETPDDPNLQRDTDLMLKEASQALDRTRRRYAHDPGVVMRAHMAEARNCQVAGKEHRASDALEKAQAVVEKATANPEATLDPIVLLDMAQSLFDIGRNEEGDALLKRLAETNADNPAVLQKINELIEEPVSMKEKLIARERNKNGIQAYEQNRFAEAISYFEEAIAITPLQVGLNLNFIQALVKMASEKPLDKRLVEAGRSSLQALSRIDASDKQYKRFIHLQERFNKVTSSGASA